MSDYEALMMAIASDNALDPDGYDASLAAIAGLPEAPTSFLEVGPGSGGFSRLLAARYPSSRVLGIDGSDFSLQVARAAGAMPPNLRFEHRAAAELSEPPKSFDVVTTTFVNHEIFPDADFVEFLRSVRLVGRKAFVFNDFVRSFGCIASLTNLRRFSSLGRLLHSAQVLPVSLQGKADVFLSPPPNVSDFILDAGLQSVKRAFTIQEYRVLFREAGYPEGSLRCSRDAGVPWQDALFNTCRITCVADLALTSIDA